ncbi:MAG: hypothetical protein IT328_04175 [Caldilineaceae bacterium]|nr:hypothetical protein [Caldilineaceae bacterium]
MLRTILLSTIISILLLAMGLAIALFWSDRFASPVFAADIETRPLYLPAVQSAPAEGTPNPVTPAPATPTPPTPPLTSAFFADMQWRTSSASIATDAQGGNHLAYVYYHGLAENVPNTGVYQFCARDCDTAAQWTAVRLGTEVNEIQLALTPQGRPRILYRTRAANNGWHFYYGSCDDQCTDAAHWTLTHVASNEGMAPLEISDDELPQRYFALDGAGRPRFVYNDRASTHYGTYYIFCDERCTDASQWREVRINKDNGNVGPYRDEDLFHPALTFSPSGQPRVVADGVSMQDEFFLYYVACDTGCDQVGNWQSAPLFPRGNGFEFSYDVEINADGGPRIAFYEGAHVNGGGNRLSYAWCNDNCTQGANWQRSELGLETLEGQEPDLELDAAGRPHIAYALYRGGGLGYSVCSAACEGAGAQWQHQVVENRTKLQEDWSVPLPLICSGGLWDGLTPVLSLDGNGNPHIAYDVTHYARCHYVGENEWEPWSEMNLVWRAVRVRLSGRGATPGTPTVTPTVTPGTPTATVTPATPTPTVTVTPSPPLPARLGSGLFPETAWRTSSSDMAIDQANGIHLVYVYTEALIAPDPDGANNPTAAVYRYCPSACEQAQSWSSVTLSEAVSEAQIGITPGGKPRLLLLVRAEEATGPADRYLYAECNANCTTLNGWQLSPIVTVPNDLSWHWIDDPQDMEDWARESQPRRYFALDPAGRPRFVYYHYNTDVDPNGVGAYYAACNDACTTPGNWTHTRVSEVTDWSGTLEWEILERPILAFTPEGSPRMLAAVLPLGILRFPGLYYLACDANCAEGSNWQKAQIGNGDDANGNWDMALDPAGRPYVVISTWWQEGLRYAWCDANCLDTTSWQVAQGPNLDAQGPDLEMDAQGEPRIVYKTTDYDETGNNPDNSLYYLKCTGNCRSTDAQWQSVRIETSEHLRAEWPASVPPACAAGEWYQFVPSLALAPAGTAHVAVDTGYIAPCQYDAATGTWQPGEDYTYSTVWRAARTVTFPQP